MSWIKLQNHSKDLTVMLETEDIRRIEHVGDIMNLYLKSSNAMIVLNATSYDKKDDRGLRVTKKYIELVNSKFDELFSTIYMGEEIEPCKENKH